MRVEFIDPFFEALGWDVRNVRGYAEQYKEVVHEDAIKISGKALAPDYSFRIGQARKFFLEAKTVPCANSSPTPALRPALQHSLGRRFWAVR